MLLLVQGGQGGHSDRRMGGESRATARGCGPLGLDEELNMDCIRIQLCPQLTVFPLGLSFPIYKLRELTQLTS